MNYFTRVAIAAGEWANPTEAYLTSLGLRIPISGKQRLVREYETVAGRMQIRLVRASDVPYFIGRNLFSEDVPYSYGTTGLDFYYEAALAGKKIRLLDFFDGKNKKGKLVLYARNKEMLAKRQPKIVARYDYKNLARKYLDQYFGRGFYLLKFVSGSDEGFVSSGEADAGFGLTVSGERLNLEKLVIIEKFLDPVVPVLIGTSESSRTDFVRLLKIRRTN